jgi:hypothetical protein
VQKAISSPDLVNNIVWKNRSFFYKAVAGNSTLCSSNNVPDTTTNTCNQLIAQATTGQCVNTNAGAPAYWDLGVVGDSSAVPGSTLPPALTVSSATQQGNLVRVVTLTFSSPHGLVGSGFLNTVSGVGISGFTGTNSNRYNGTFTVSVTSLTTLTYLPTGNPPPNGVTAAQFAALGKTNVKVQPPAIATFALSPTYSVLTNTAGYPAAANNISTDPLLADMYCNGSRVAPEFPSVINPPSPKTLQVAATVDEGNNYVTLRYGPLYTSKPNTAGTVFTPFGDAHIPTTSTAKDTGTTVDAINHDYDGDQRGPGTTGPNKAYDRGADEFRYPTPTVTLSVTSLSFGGQPVGTTSAPQSVTVSNTGDAPLVFNAANAVSATGPFAIAAGSTCANNATIAAGSSCVINVTFASAAPTGNKTGTLTLRDNAGTLSQTVNLSGTATQVTVAFTAASQGTLSTNGGQRTLAFGNVSGANTSVVTLTASNGAVTFGSASVTNSIGSGFSKAIGADNCSGHTVPSGGTCTITINFAAPNGNTNRVGTLTVNDNAPTAGSSQTLRLTGS